MSAFWIVFLVVNLLVLVVIIHEARQSDRNTGETAMGDAFGFLVLCILLVVFDAVMLLAHFL